MCVTCVFVDIWVKKCVYIYHGPINYSYRSVCIYMYIDII